MNLNRATIAGRITRDPEMKALPSGSSVTAFSVATNNIYTKDGQRVEDVEYHNIIVFGKQAESCAQYLKKGQLVLVEGRIKTRSWEAEGRKNYRTEIIAERVQFGPRGEGSPARSADEHAQRAPKDPDVPAIEYPTAESEGINPEDIPF